MLQIQRKPYRRFDLDLSVARTNQQFYEVGSFIWVEECDGVVEIKLDDNQAAFFKLIDGAFYKVSEYNQFWIKNTAQAGKSLKALIGDAKFFRCNIKGGNGGVTDHALLTNVLPSQHHTKTTSGEIALTALADVDDFNLGPNRILKYNTGTSKHEYVDIPAKTPDYDSGWFAAAQNSNTVKTHDLGTTDLLVDIQGKDTVGEINQKYVGGDIQWDNDASIYVSHGAYWHYLSSTTVLIHRNAEDINWAQIRVRIWKI